jgi:hypothetical protein
MQLYFNNLLHYFKYYIIFRRRSFFILIELFLYKRNGICFFIGGKAVISSVVSTVSTVSTVTSSTAKLGLMSTLVLIALLIVKELSGAKAESMEATGMVTLSRALDRVMNVAIVPLLIVFGFIVIVQIIGILH